MSHTPIDFARLAEALLQRVESLLPRWLPGGVERNDRWYVGDFDGSKGESANVNMRTGQWIDNAAPDTDVGRDLISLYARVFNKGNAEAARELMDELGWRRDDEASRAVQTSAPSPKDRPASAPEGGEAVAAAGKAKRAKVWRPIVPVPVHAPIPTFVHGYKDKNKDVWVELEAVSHWRYEFEGRLYGYVARFERVNSSGELVKDTLPLTWCEDLGDGRGFRRWHWKQWEDPRPLYVPAGVLSADGRPVVLVEGEKCAEAGHKLLGDEFDFVSWPGGCKTWSMAAWSWLIGRTVFMWPDADAQRARLTKDDEAQGITKEQKDYLPLEKQPGYSAMVKIGSVLLADHRCNVNICLRLLKPGTQPAGWDIADAIESGWSRDQVRDHIRSASAFHSPNDEARAKAASTASEADASDDETAVAWRKKLFLTGTGAIKACRENIVLACDGVPDLKLPGDSRLQGVIAFNEFTNEVMKLRDPPWGTGAGRWQEEDELELGNWLSRELWLPPMPRGTLEEAVLMVAKRHKYHPVREHLRQLNGTWDGTRRLSTWLRRVCLEEDEFDDRAPLQRYLARAGTWFVMAMCARVLPEKRVNGELYQGAGTKFDYMLVFEGEQGWGKSTIPRILAGDEWFADTGLVLGEKDSYQNIQGVLVYEWGEMDSMAKAEVTKVKLFVASPKDRFRATFDRRPRDYPRQVVFVGTTNEDHYLTDLTGNRRFWPVRLQRPADLAWLRANRDQLLAEALVLLEQGDRFFPTPDEQRKLFNPQQQERAVDNAIDMAIRRYLYDEDQKVPHAGVNGTTVNQISLDELLGRVGYSIDKQTTVVMKQAGSVMSRLGWATTRPASAKDSDGHRPRVYHRPKERPQSAKTDGDDFINGPARGHDTTRASDACPV